MFARAANAFLLHVASVSPSMKVARSSDASGINDGECANIEDTAKTAFLRTYACRCSRQDRADESRGSMSSGSRNLQRKRSVFPRIYSFGC